MDTLPLFFNLYHKNVLIIGGGNVAYRKAILLNRAGARLIVLSKSFIVEFQEFLINHQHQIIQKEYQNDDLDYLKNISFIICATDNHELNKQVYHHAKDLNIPINVVDTPKFCDFIFPAIVDRNPIVIGISSGGNAPVLARLIRAKIETILPNRLGDIAKIAGKFRQTVKEKLTDLTKRRYFWEKIFDKAINDKPIKDLENELADFISHHTTTMGEVYIVGAGAGDPDLLTFKALRLMGQADVVLYDALVPQAIVDLCRRDSDKIFVGKKRSNHTKTQSQINELLIKYAKAGKRVLRLKGGDPFIFGRGGEEVLACQQAGVPYQVVSGITSALAAASGTGIALTHRGMATSVRFLTACYQTNDHFDGLKSIYHSDETLVFYMGLHALDKVVQNLINSGLSNHTPVAIVAHASLPTQQVLIGDLSNIVQKQEVEKLPTPALIIVGDVVKLYKASI